MNTKILDYRDNQNFNEKIDEILTQGNESIEINGVVHIKDSNNSSININIRHIDTKTTSKVILRAVVEDNAKLNIYGDLTIEKDADDSDAFFEAKVLLLGDKSRAIVVPELKINNKNVKAKHAVVIKKISNDDLYFLQSRGIERQKATKQIIEGFLNISYLIKD